MGFISIWKLIFCWVRVLLAVMILCPKYLWWHELYKNIVILLPLKWHPSGTKTLKMYVTKSDARMSHNPQSQLRPNVKCHKKPIHWSQKLVKFSNLGTIYRQHSTQLDKVWRGSQKTPSLKVLNWKRINDCIRKQLYSTEL